MKSCPVCGKIFYVQYPNKWQYKRDNRFICSWRCLRLLDKGDKNMPRLLTDEQRNHAVQIAINGYDPKPFLVSCGSNAPDKLWSYIKQTIRDKDPETYQKLPTTLKGLRPPGVAEPLRIETHEANKVEVIETPAGVPVPPPFEYKVTWIDTAVGTFQYFKHNRYLDWTDLNGETVSMTLEEWKEFMKIWPFILKTLGVEL